jgi:glyoxylase-like metal-dependent hydrolase (beta-lactamase superfamily II)
MNNSDPPLISTAPHAKPFGRSSRAEFLARVTFGLAAAATARSLAAAADPAIRSAPPSAPQDRKDAKVKQWDVITMGNLARNRYWGETGPKASRSTLCTCTLIQGEGFRLLVDPSLAKAEQMAAEVDRRTGLKVADIDSVFVTHHHDDHWFGLVHFPVARWFAAPEVADAINRTKRLPKPVEPAGGPVFAAISLVPTPGHTPSHHSLRFTCDGKAVVIAGDAVMTRDHWRERQGHHNSADLALAARSIEQLSVLADIVVPGHDNYFLNLKL